ncbi:MAG: Gfo/Idh/MocA family oxidoreductase [Candidatus Glassbacteria bacterium]|nr:Gfo/Idh/MocA family oxidoreductase [Candidatus Glassbacteria bacterium]
MKDQPTNVSRRDFLKNSSASLAALGALGFTAALPAQAAKSTPKTRLAIVGTGARGIGMWGAPVARDYADYIEIVGLCDINSKRVEVARSLIGSNISDMDGMIRTEKPKQGAARTTGANIPTFTDFDEMVRTVKPDRVIVTTVDAIHARYVVRAMELGCDVICEKPFATDEEQCQAIIEAQKKYQRNITVTFNARYGSSTARVKELLKAGEIGDLYSVDYAEFLDTDHGASYFRRWHGLKECSGTLLVHKASHHFDELNWWIDSDPVEVSANGDLRKFGRNGPFRHINCRQCVHKDKCRYYWDITRDKHLTDLYVNCESEDGYFRDGCLYRYAINIYDTMSVLVRYANKVLVTYSLNAGVPDEGQIIVFNGSKGRIEVRNFSRQPWEVAQAAEVRLMRNFEDKSTLVPVERRSGSHGGSDTLIKDHVFIPGTPDDLAQRAGMRAGIMSAIIGIAGYHSIETGRPVKIRDLVDFG